MGKCKFTDYIGKASIDSTFLLELADVFMLLNFLKFRNEMMQITCNNNQVAFILIEQYLSMPIPFNR